MSVKVTQSTELSLRVMVEPGHQVTSQSSDLHSAVTAGPQLVAVSRTGRCTGARLPPPRRRRTSCSPWRMTRSPRREVSPSPQIVSTVKWSKAEVRPINVNIDFIENMIQVCGWMVCPSINLCDSGASYSYLAQFHSKTQTLQI